MREFAYLVALLALPMAVSGADLVFEFQGTGEYDSNVFRQEGNAKGDAIFRLRPGVRIEEKQGQDVNYSLRYLAPVELSVENSDQLDNVDQYGDLSFSYQPSGRVEFYGTDQFRYDYGTLLSFATLDEQGASTTINSRDRTTRNTASAGVRYQFSRNLEGDFSIQHQLFESRREDRQDNWVLSLNPNFFYRLNPRHRIGMGVSYYHQDFDASDFTVGSQTDTVNAYAQWEWQIDSTMGLSVRVGPAYIESEQDNPPDRFILPIPVQELSDFDGMGPAFLFQPYTLCEAFTTPGSGDVYVPPTGCGTDPGTVNLVIQEQDPAGYAAIETANQTPIGLTTVGNVNRKDDSVDVFVNVQLVKNWSPQLSSLFAYQRSQGTASGLGGTVIRDSVTGSLSWRFRERWSLSANGAWTNRESVGDVNEFFLLAEDIGGNIAGYTGDQLVAATSSQRVETELWSISARLSHRLYRRTHVFAQGTYTDQASKRGSLGASSDFDDWLAIVGVRHEFEPIGLW
ncbi:MAG: hypothetical protein HRU02_00065 [Myxococcales bacterium]|nr:hypothetical protein [Myxococcales bacterium]